MGTETTDTWMRVPEAAAYFRVPRSRMYDLIQRGELPAVRIGRRSIRVNVRDVERFLAENRRINPRVV
jgi:excisionase family DNA binding protein